MDKWTLLNNITARFNENRDKTYVQNLNLENYASIYLNMGSYRMEVVVKTVKPIKHASWLLKGLP